MMNTIMNIKPSMKKAVICTLIVVLILMMTTATAFADTGVDSHTELLKSKAFAAAVVIGLAAFAGVFAMGQAITKSSESIARQPEADGKIRTTLMLGLVFIETVVIYALIVAILIIFVL